MTNKNWTYRIGSQAPLEFQLTEDGAPVNLTGATLVEIRLEPDNGSVLNYTTSTPSKLAITDTPNGKVTYYPGAEITLAMSHLDVYFWVTKADTRKYDYPHDRAFRVRLIDAH